MFNKMMVLIGLLFINGMGNTQQVNDGFSPEVNDSVRKLITINAGHVLVGGTFTQVSQGVEQAYLAAFNNDGSLFSTFNPELNSVVNDMVQQPDGKILVAGAFTQVNGQSRSYLVRLQFSGTIDATFNPILSASIQALALYPDGRIVVAGQFPGKLRRLHADGSIDNSFSAQLNNQALVDDLLVNHSNQLVVAGDFNTVNGVAKSHLARLTTDGSLDTSFNPNGDPNWPVRALASQSNGQVVAGGEFTVIGGQNQTALARFKSTGELDNTFDPDINGSVSTLSTETSGHLILGGSFTAIDGESAVRVARLNSLGNPVNFALGYSPDAMVTASTVLHDGDVIIGGEFLQLGSVVRNRLARLHRTRGALDQDLLLSPSGGSVHTMAKTINGNYLIAGSFSGINGQSTDNIIEIGADGDAIINSQFASTNGAFIHSILVDTFDIYLGGDFTIVNGQPRHRLAKLFTNGGLNTSFNCNVNGTVYALAKWNEYILVAGNFSEINGVARQNLAMINTQCSVVSAFNVPVTGGVIRSVQVQADGRILLSGGFKDVNGFNRNRMARLLMVGQQGLVDGFNPNFDGTVTTMMQLAEGQVVVAGSFNRVATRNLRRGLALLDSDGGLSSKLQLALGDDESIYSMAALANGRIILAGNFSEIDGISKNHVAMIKPNLFNSGNYQVDSSFTVDANNVVRSIMPTQNGKVFLLGSFSEINGISRFGIARISQSSYARELFTANGNQVRWRQYGSAPLLSRPPVMDIRENGAQQIIPEPMEYHDGYWQLSIDSSSFSDTPIDFNLSGKFQAGFNNNSTVIHALKRYEIDYSDLIFANGFQLSNAIARNQ